MLVLEVSSSPKEFQWCFKAVFEVKWKWLVQRNFKGISMVFNGCFKAVSMKFQECFKEV